MFFEKTINSRPHNWLIHDVYVKSLQKYESYINGTVLDIGCGQKPYKKIITKKDIKYFGLEHLKTLHGFSEVDVTGSALQLPFKNSVADLVVSFQVMEHIPEPELFLMEIFRVLKPGGNCLLMTPFIWGEHEIPYDYFRYTRYGIKYLADKTGFKVLSINADVGSLTTLTIRFNYFIMQRAGRILRHLIIPFVWVNQFVARKLDYWFDNERTDTANFTTLLHKN